MGQSDIVDTRDIKIYFLHTFNKTPSLYFKLACAINILNKKEYILYVTSIDTCVKTHYCEK